jgi:hypothetical protein
VATYVLDCLSGDEAVVRRQVTGAYASAVGREAVDWCLPYASPSAWNGIVAATSERLAPLLATYSRARALLSGTLQCAIDPRVGGAVGLAFALNRRGALIFTFVRHSGASQAVPFEAPILLKSFNSRTLPVEQLRELIAFQRDHETGNIVGQEAMSVLADPARVGAEMALKSLREAVAAGGLDEGDYVPLLQERVTALTAFLRRELGFKTTQSIPLAAQLLHADLFPLDLDDLQDRVDEAVAVFYHKHLWMEARRAEEIEARLKRGDKANISVVHSGEWNLEGFRRAARRDLAEGRRYAPTIAPPELRALAAALEALRRLGITRLQEPLLPMPDLVTHQYTGGPESDYSVDRLRELVERYFTSLLDAYDAITFNSFAPPLQAQIRSVCRTPAVVIAYVVYDEALLVQARQRRHIRYSIIEVPPDIAARNWSEVRVEPEESPFIGGPSILGQAETQVGRLPVHHRAGMSLYELFQARDSRPMASRAEPTSGRDAPVRGGAYALVERALRDLKTEELLRILLSNS